MSVVHVHTFPKVFTASWLDFLPHFSRSFTLEVQLFPMEWNTSVPELFCGDPARPRLLCVQQGRLPAVVAMLVSSLPLRTLWWNPHPHSVAPIVLVIIVRSGSDPKTSPRVADRSTSDVATPSRERCNVDSSVQSLRVSTRILPSVTGGQRRTTVDKTMCTCDSLATLRRIGSENEPGNVNQRADKAKSSPLDQRSEGTNVCHG